MTRMRLSFASVRRASHRWRSGLSCKVPVEIRYHCAFTEHLNFNKLYVGKRRDHGDRRKARVVYGYVYKSVTSDFQVLNSSTHPNDANTHLTEARLILKDMMGLIEKFKTYEDVVVKLTRSEKRFDQGNGSKVTT